MIVSMRKLSLLVFYKDYQSFLEELREKGVVHIYENKQRSAEDEALQGKLRFIKRLNEMIRLLENRGIKEKGGRVEVPEEDLLSYLEGQYHRQEQIAVQLGELEKEIAKDLQDEIDSFKARKMTLNAFYEDYIEQKQELKTSTRTNYKYMYKKYVSEELSH